EMDALLRQARQRGVAADDALAFIEDYAATRGWRIQQAGVELPAAALRYCGFCSALVPPAAASCPSCGRPLEIACPRCGAQKRGVNAACERCGCRLGDAPLVEALLRDGERLAGEGDFPAAVRCFDKALVYWPDWRPAREARGRVEEAQRRREAELAAVES